MSRAFGYLKGEQFSLDRIRQEFPELKDDVTKSELEFSTSFRKASDRITEQLKRIIGTDYLKFDSLMTESIKSAMAGQEITKEQALKFLEEVRNRAKGKIESHPVLETLSTVWAIHPCIPQENFHHRAFCIHPELIPCGLQNHCSLTEVLPTLSRSTD